MKITVKKIRTWEGRDGYGASCDVYVEGVLVGNARDDGNGGGLWIYPNYLKNDQKAKELRAKAEAWVKTQPDIVTPWGTFPMEKLEDYVDNLINEELDCKEHKKIEKKFDKAIIYGDKYEFHTVTLKGVSSLTEYAKHPNGLKNLQEIV